MRLFLNTFVHFVKKIGNSRLLICRWGVGRDFQTFYFKSEKHGGHEAEVSKHI